ncbi:hypothetical protein [Leptospira wolbachii]|uniref:hypothetical protein n=1 Tax=Leptospira wolbachii TaxID=29511 RepID=UPI0012EB7B37|nr:hypothetical protein [Leptospira wolbachii]
MKISQSEQANDLVKRFSFIAMLLTTGGLLFALLHVAPPLIGRIQVQRGQVTALFTKDVRTTKSIFTLYYATVNGLNFLIPFNFYVSIHIDDLIELVYPRPLFARFSGKYLEPFYFRQVNGKESITTSDKEI